MAPETEIFDDGLKAMFGDRFHDMQDSGKPVAKTITKATSKEIAIDAPWESENKNNVMRGNVLRCLAYAGLNLLVFFWQQKTLVDPAVATPCMWACTCACGYYIGKTVRKSAE